MEATVLVHELTLGVKQVAHVCTVIGVGVETFLCVRRDAAGYERGCHPWGTNTGSSTWHKTLLKLISGWRSFNILFCFVEI